MAKGFTLLEVLIAVVLLSLAFGAFAVSAERLVSASLSASEATVAGVVASNAMNEAVNLGRAYTDRTLNVMGVSLKVEQSFENFMNFRVVSITVTSSLTGREFSLYEAR